MALFIIGSLPITNSVSAEDEVDNWPENDAWLYIELLSWSANETVEWDNNNGLPDPHFEICIEADGVNIDCIDTPTWDNQMELVNPWNYSIDIPDYSNILNITIECRDNDAINDDECDMNSELDEWKLFAEYNWSLTPTKGVIGNGDGDGNGTWKNAASEWRFTIDGYGDEDSDGVSDNIDLCADTPDGDIALYNSTFIGCSWGQLDYDSDGVENNLDVAMYNSGISVKPTQSATALEWFQTERSTISNSMTGHYNYRPIVVQLNSETNLKSIVWNHNIWTVLRENSIQHQVGALERSWCGGGYESISCSSGGGWENSQFIDFNHDGFIDSIGSAGLFLQANITDYPSDIETPGFSYEENFSFQMEIIPMDNSHFTWDWTGNCGNSGIHTGYDKGTLIDLNNDGLMEIWFVDSQINDDCESPRIYTFPEESFDLKESYPDVETVVIPMYNTLTSSDCNYNYDEGYGAGGTYSELNFEYGHHPIFAYEENSGFTILVCSMSQFSGERTKVMWTNSGEIVNEEIFITPLENSQHPLVFDGLGGLGDLNQDGWMDYLRSPNVDECYAYLGSSIGFDSEQGIKIGDFECNNGMNIIDLDGDGDLDISGDNTLAFNNDGNWEYMTSATGRDNSFWGPHSISDLDNDGDYDRIVSTDNLEIFFNPSILDTDGDSVEDQFDLCMDTDSSEISNSAGCSLSQIDSDYDGIYDSNDLCSDTPLGFEIDSNGCAEYQKDDDNDGINNSLDECPNTPEGDLINIRGCSFEDSQDLDSDNDGVLDSADACPNTTADVTVDSIGCDLDGNQTPDTDSDGDGVYGSLDDCANTPSGTTVDFRGCPMDSDFDGVYDGIDECPSSNNPSPSDMDKSSEVDSTGCFIDAAGSESDSGSAAFGCLGMIVMIGVVVFVVRKVRSPKQEQVFYPRTQPVISPVQQQFVSTPQISSRERELEHQSRQAQIEAQRLRQELANQAQFTQKLQSEVAQKQMSDAALAQKQNELVVAQKEKEELEAKLAEAEKNTPIIQNITYNIQDSAISGNITNKIN